MIRFEAPDSTSSNDSSESDGSESSSGYSDSDDSSSNDSEDSRKKTCKRKRSASGSESEGLTNTAVPKASGLALSQLYMMDDGNAGEDESYFAQQGKNPSRVKEVLKHHQCCKGNCKRLLPFKLVMHMVTIFWCMPKASQDCVLWAMQQRGAKEFDPNDSSSSSSSRHQISWSIEGLLSWLSGGITSFFHEVLNSQWLAWEATLYAGKPSWSCWASVQHALSELGGRLKELMVASLVSLQIIIRVWGLNSIIYLWVLQKFSPKQNSETWFPKHLRFHWAC